MAEATQFLLKRHLEHRVMPTIVLTGYCADQESLKRWEEIYQIYNPRTIDCSQRNAEALFQIDPRRYDVYVEKCRFRHWPDVSKELSLMEDALLKHASSDPQQWEAYSQYRSLLFIDGFDKASLPRECLAPRDLIASFYVKDMQLRGYPIRQLFPIVMNHY